MRIVRQPPDQLHAPCPRAGPIALLTNPELSSPSISISPPPSPPLCISRPKTSSTSCSVLTPPITPPVSSSGRTRSAFEYTQKRVLAALEALRLRGQETSASMTKTEKDAVPTKKNTAKRKNRRKAKKARDHANAKAVLESCPVPSNAETGDESISLPKESRKN